MEGAKSNDDKNSNMGTRKSPWVIHLILVHATADIEIVALLTPKYDVELRH